MEISDDLKHRINQRTIDNIASFHSKYDKETDTLFIQPKIPVPAVSVDWDGDFWVRVKPDTGEVVGIEIEDYKEFFTKKYHPVLRGRNVTDPAVKKIVIALLRLGAKPFTRKEFIQDLERACQRILA
jgi:uncharacterized protein YuzE